MKLKAIGLALVSFLVLFAAVSCAGSPPVEGAGASGGTAQTGQQEITQGTAPQGPSSQDQAALNAAAARAEAARKFASDFDGAIIFSQEWLAAESLYNQAEQQRSSGTSAEAQESALRYNMAADAFEVLNGMIISNYYENAERELNDARETAVKAGAQVYTPDFLLETDTVVAEALRKYQAKDYYAAKDAFEKALLMYSILNTGLKANMVRMELEERGFEGYDSSNLDLAENNIAGAAADFSSENYAAAKNKAEASLFHYEAALKTAWEIFAGEKAASANAMRQRALGLKANVAVRQDFDNAETVFSRADTEYRRQNFEESAILYIECESMYALVADTALEKQRLAEEALRRADQRAAESDEAARDAELIVEGGGE
jgi:hypothetical protein